MAELPAVQSPADLSVEAREFARELVAAQDRMIHYYAARDKLSLAEASVRTGGSTDVDWNEQTRHASADQVTWSALDSLAYVDPDAAQVVWERVKDVARDELASGNRASRVLEGTTSPLHRARFLVLRATFREEWRPRGGIEAALVDTLAQAYAAQEFWLQQLHRQATFEGREEDDKRKTDGYWVPPRVSTEAAMEQSATMTDRFNRLFLRTLRALRDLRRYSSPVVIQNAGQVNVGERQVNVLTTGDNISEDAAKPTPKPQIT